jgi:5-formyltetrahydrofolate cyclo-ligase
VSEDKRVAHGGKISGMNEISLAKATIRKQILNLRKSGNQSNQGLLENLLAIVKMHNPKRVATYISYPTEPDTKAFIQNLLVAGVTVLVPETLEDGKLSWHEYAKTAEVSLAAGDLLFVPALAVDELGNRLGRGKGYFDREISTLNDVLVYAVVFENEVLDTVPVEAHDQRVDGVVTQEQIRKIN